MMTKTHHYFLLDLSPWPVIISVSSFNFMASLLMFFKFGFFSGFVINLSFLVLSSFLWWFSYSSEFNLKGNNSYSLDSGVKLSMILFISSEVFFFFSFFWAYFHYFLSPTLDVGLVWPPVNVGTFDFTNVPLINTLVLMSSGLTVTVSHSYLIFKKMSKAYFWLSLTVVLGALFSYLQWDEYCNSFFSISDGNFGTSFFVLTGFHGIHVLIGSAFLLSVLCGFKIFSTVVNNCLSFELASWYWHFVDVVWLFLYFFLYYITY